MKFPLNKIDTLLYTKAGKLINILTWVSWVNKRKYTYKLIVNQQYILLWKFKVIMEKNIYLTQLKIIIFFLLPPMHFAASHIGICAINQRFF